MALQLPKSRTLAKRWGIGLAALAVVVGTLVGFYQAPQTKADGDVLITDGTGDGSYNGMPSGVRLPDNSIYMAHNRNQEHQSAGGYIVAKTSTDDGESWSPATTVIAPQAGSDDAFGTGGLLRLPSGRLVMAVDAFDAVTNTSARNFRGFVIRSDDNGQTWDSPTTISNGFTEWHYPSDMILLPDNSILMALYGKDRGSPNNFIRLSRSTDQGQTWNQWGIIVWGTNGAYTDNRQWQEPQLAYGNNGSLLITLRSPAYGPGDTDSIFLASSTNSGKNWTTPKRIISKASGMPTIDKLHNGAWGVMYRDMSAAPYPTKYAVSFDLQTWAVGGKFTEQGGRMLYGDWLPSGDHTTVLYGIEGPNGSTGYANVWRSIVP